MRIGSSDVASMCCAGIGKTTLANEICLRWARDGFLSEDFDVVLLIPMMSVQQRSLQEVMIEYLGRELYMQIESIAGRRCLIILEGLDETEIYYRQNDEFLRHLIYECCIFEKSVVVITSRPHACVDLHADRKIEILGFSTEMIDDFVLKSFPSDDSSAKKLLQQLSEYSQLHNFCCIPFILAIVVNIFQDSKNILPSEIYRLLLEHILQRLVKIKRNFHTATIVADHDKVEALCKYLKDIPKETASTVLMLSMLAYHSFIDWSIDMERKIGSGYTIHVKKPKMFFTKSDLVHCGMHASSTKFSEFEGFGLLNVYRPPSVYKFLHTSIQEFLCLLYISLLPQQNQMDCFEKLFDCSNYFKMWLNFTSPLDKTVLTNCK